MIGHFPTAYPDELFYSLCARYSRRVSYPSVKSVLLELLGASTASAVIDLPNRLGYFVASLPAGTPLTVDRLIHGHTLFPFFSSFLPVERVEQLRTDMRLAAGPAAYYRSGIMASPIPQPAQLKFCPVCARENVADFGEAYWHRLHQSPGVIVCPTHRTYLENSNVGLRANRKHLQFIPAEQAIRSAPTRHVDGGNRGHQALLQTAQDAEWLLNHPSLGTNLESLYARYLRLLVDRGLATYTGRIHVKELLSEFVVYYSPALLQLLHCELRGGNVEKATWLLRLVRPSKQARHPLYHLLLIQFLGCTVEEFFQLPEELSPFGRDPWPCLNPAAAHYRQPVIMECQSGDRLRYGKPSGRFSCECGFIYVRTGPDSSPEDRFRVGRIVSFGQVWEDKLKQLWKDSSLSISEIGRRLGVDPLTVRRHAARLELSFSRSDKALKPLTPATQLKGEAVSAAWEEKRLRCRSKWLSTMKQERKIILKALREKLPREYAWLLQHDSEWLEAHKPPTRRRNLPASSVDWKRRDAEYAAAVRAEASRLRAVPGRPVRVTRTAIGRALGAITLLRQKLHKMPLTTQIFSSVLETREQYAVRRVWWAADLYQSEGVIPREWQLVERANVCSLKGVSAVECAVEGALNMLNSKLSRPYGRQAAS